MSKSTPGIDRYVLCTVVGRSLRPAGTAVNQLLWPGAPMSYWQRSGKFVLFNSYTVQVDQTEHGPGHPSIVMERAGEGND